MSRACPEESQALPLHGTALFINKVEASNPDKRVHRISLVLPTQRCRNSKLIHRQTYRLYLGEGTADIVGHAVLQCDEPGLVPQRFQGGVKIQVPKLTETPLVGLVEFLQCTVRLIPHGEKNRLRVVNVGIVNPVYPRTPYLAL